VQCVNVRVQVLNVCLDATFYALLANQESCVSMMVVTTDPDQEPLPVNSRLWCFILFPL